MEKPNLLPQNNGTSLKRDLGLAAATAIVIGNTIGSGIFMSPTSMAKVSNPTTCIIAWVITAIGSLLIALSLSNLASAMPKTGGPIVYTRAALGDFAGFIVAWTYWVGAWIGNAAIITGFMSYLAYFFPVLNTNKLLAFLICTAIVWIFTLINIYGVKEAGIVSIITTVLKILPLIIFIIIAAMHFAPSNFNTVASPETSGMKTLPGAIAIALWGFVGLESASVAGGEIKNAEKIVKKSTMYGILFTAIIYILISTLAMGAMSQGALAKSGAPLADIIDSATGGKWGGILIALGALISTLGATSGWFLTTARSAFAAAEDKLFPTFFAKVHPKAKTPYVSLIISAAATNMLLILNYVQSLADAFNFMILLATLSFLPVYAFCAIAEIVLLSKHPKNFNIFNFIKNSFFALLAFAYSIYAIYGTGAESVMYGFILILVGLPFYIYMMFQHNKELKAVDNARKAAGLLSDNDVA